MGCVEVDVNDLIQCSKCELLLTKEEREFIVSGTPMQNPFWCWKYGQYSIGHRPFIHLTTPPTPSKINLTNRNFKRKKVKKISLFKNLTKGPTPGNPLSYMDAALDVSIRWSWISWWTRNILDEYRVTQLRHIYCCTSLVNGKSSSNGTKMTIRV